MTAHSHIGASSSNRWMNCPGSVRLIAQCPPEGSSKYALQGTAAHWVLEDSLLTESDPLDYGGEVYVSDDKDEYRIKKSDCEAVGVAFDYVMEKVEAGWELHTEARVSLPTIHESMFGTADIVLVSPCGTKLEIADYKHGSGIFVNAVDNSQMLYYGLGAITLLREESLQDGGAFGEQFDEVTLTVMQPRYETDEGPIRSWVVEPAYLDEFAAKLRDAGKATEDPNAPCNAGSWCKFCPAHAFCPEQVRILEQELAEDFQPLTNPGSHPPAPEMLTPDQLGRVLAFRKQVEDWFSAVYKRAEELAGSGQDVPGYKLVAKRAHRKWKDEDGAVEALSLLAGADELFTRKLVTPAKAEKIVGKELVSELAFTPDNGVVLAPDSDKRTAVGGDATKEFSPVTK